MKMPRRKVDYDSRSDSCDTNDLDKDSDEYLRRRARNNVAVKKSREKTRKKAKATAARVAELRQENLELEHKAATLSKELGLLKDLFLAKSAAADQQSELKNVGATLQRALLDIGMPESKAEQVLQDHLYYNESKLE